MTERRWAWAEIDLSAIARNVATLKGLTRPGTLFMAVVKADGYGHGAVRVANAALAAGADRLGVATVGEALDLRAAGITAPIQLLSEPPEASAALLVEHGIIPTVDDAVVRWRARSRSGSGGDHVALPPQGRHRHESHRRAGRGRAGVRRDARRVPRLGARGHVHSLRDRRRGR